MAVPTIRFSLKPLIEGAFLAAAGLLIISHFLGSSGGSQSMFSVVISGSMEPQVQRGDVIIWVPATAEDLEIGDVAIFSSYKWKDTTVSHRVVNITYKGGVAYLVTKGDNNNYTDQARGEPTVSSGNLLGKGMTVGDDKRLFKIPYAGWVMLLATDFFTSMTEHIFQGESSTMQVGVLLPMMGSMGIMVVAMVVLNPKKDEKLKMVQLIFGPENVRIRRVFAYALGMFVVFLVSTAFVAYDEVSVAIGINGNIPREQEARMNFDKVEPGLSSNRTLPINAPALLGVKGIIFQTGDKADWLESNASVFHVPAKGRLEPRVTVMAPENTTSDIYYATIFIYSSPYWILLPDSFIDDTTQWNPHAAVFIFDIISALYMALISVFILALMAYITDTLTRWKVYMSWEGVRMHPHLVWLYKRMGGTSRITRIREVFHPTAWMNDIDWYRFEPTIPLIAGVGAGVLMLPLAIAGRSFEGVLLAAPLAGLFAYLAGSTYRAQVILAGVTAEGLVMGLGLAFAISVPAGMDIMLMLMFLGEVGAIFSLLFVLLIIPAAALAFLAAYVLHHARIRYYPDDALGVNSDI